MKVELDHTIVTLIDERDQILSDGLDANNIHKYRAANELITFKTCNQLKMQRADQSNEEGRPVIERAEKEMQEICSRLGVTLERQGLNICIKDRAGNLRKFYPMPF